MEFLIERIKRTLCMTFQEEQEYVARLLDARTSCAMFKGFKRKYRFPLFLRQDWRHDFPCFFITVLQGRMEFLMPEFFKNDQIIDDGLAHEDIVFDDRRDLIPLRLAAMAEGAAITEPVEDSYCRQEKYRVERILSADCVKGRIRGGR